MKFERTALEEYLVSNLKPLTAADPKILADYVVALLKNEMPTGELLKLCADRLEVFLGSSSMSFTAKLFQGLQDGSISSTDANLGIIKDLEPAHCNNSVDTSDQKSLQHKEANDSTSSGPDSDPGDKENTDDDDDRNHKHRKRDARPTSSDNGVQELPTMTLSRKRSKTYVTRQLNVEIGTIDKENHSRMEKRHSGIQQSVCGPSDLSSRSRLNSSFRADPSSRMDLSTSIGRASGGRGRGKSSAGWIRPDSRLNSLDTIDFAPHMASQGPAHPSLFVSPGLQGVGSSQNASWSPFGFIHGMPGGILDPLHPLALQAALRPAMNPPINLGLPRQRCRDFEERGFCLRGDMCPMEHGVNRIVVEDVQSLSQFNLPVSIPSSQALVQIGTGSIPPGPASSAVVTSKTLPCKNNKSSANEDDEPRFTDLSSVASEADVYDPDQPLWNSNHHVSSGALLRLPASNTEEDTIWDGSAAFRKSSRLSDGNECDLSSRNLTGNIGRQSAGSSVWGHTGSGSKSEIGVKFDNNGSTTGHLTQAMREVEENVSNSVLSSQDKHTAGDFGSEVAVTQPVSNSIPDYRRRSGRMHQKASRTLYVNGIPQKNNKREALLSHFRKFGEVIDVYIPVNSEKAFVQFSRKEEAEAALKSPDAVMGNRFIKLFWANRDRISDEGLSSGLPKSLHYPKTSADSVQIHPPVVSGGKDNLSSAAHKKSSLVPVEVPLPSFGPQRSTIMNGPKALTSPTKKQENLELLEELRKKQEILDQKREEFRRQLVKFERQASLKKGEVASELVAKSQKLNSGIASAKAADPRPTTSNSGECQDDGKTLEKSTSGEINILPSSRAYPAIMQQSPRIVKQSARMVAPNPHRFKLDNRSTSFRVLPPLPAKLANVAVLKDHFSKFGDLASIVFEDSEEILNEQTDKLGSKELDNCFIRVKYHTRHSAERAYQAGKSWEGCSLKFAWVTTSLSSDKDNLVQEVPINTLPCVAGDDANKASMEPSFLSSMGETTYNSSAGSPSLSLGEPTCVPASDVDTKKIEGPDMNIESTNCASNSMIKSRSTIPMHENENDNSNELIDNDNIEANLAQ